MAIFIAGLIPIKGGRLRNFLSDLPAPPQPYTFYPSQLYLHNMHSFNSWMFLDFLILERKSLASFRILKSAFTVTAHNPRRQT